MTDSNNSLVLFKWSKKYIVNTNIQISKALPLIDLVSSPPLAKLTREDWALAFFILLFCESES